MNKRKIAVGPGASSLILIAVVLALSVLTVLTMISARNDESLALRSVETRQEAYGLFAQGEESFSRLDAVAADCLGEHPEDGQEYLRALADRLPEGMRMKGDQVFWTERRGDRALECGARILMPGELARVVWTKHQLGAEDIWEEDDFGDWDDGFEDAEDEEDADEEETDQLEEEDGSADEEPEFTDEEEENP